MESVFSIDRESVIGPLISLILFFVLLGITNRAIKPQYYLNKNNLKWAIFILLIFAIFAAFGGDWFHYQEILGRIQGKGLSWDEIQYVSTQVHLEIVYWYIAYAVKYNYLLFRFIVFGGAIVILFYSVRKSGQVRLPVYIAFFVAGSILSFTTSRVCLAQSIAFMGATLIYSSVEKKRQFSLSFVFGAALIFASFFFHKSALFFIVIIFLSLLPFNYRTIVIAVLLFPVLLYVTNEYVVELLMESESDEEASLNYTSFQSYLSGNRTYSIGTAIAIFFNRVYWYSLFILSIGVISLSKKVEVPYLIRKYAMMTFWIIIVASTFILQNQIIYNRLIAFCNIAALPVLSYCLVSGYKRKFVLVLYYLGIGIVLYSLILLTAGRLFF